MTTLYEKIEWHVINIVVACYSKSSDVITQQFCVDLEQRGGDDVPLYVPLA